ncbi:MAG TPA: condensation domain-containing protein, partial [Thermoanaerobaculia bacterium]
MLRAFLRERLPEPMLPSSFVRLAVLPLTPNGKIDRKALQDEIVQAGGNLPGHASGAVTDAPRGLLEERIAAIWREVLASETERIDPTASFFEIGGHSLLATRVMSRLRGVFGVELPVRTLFEAPSVRELARRVEAALDAARGGAESRARPPISRRTAAGPPPLSFAQERLWFLDRLEAGAVYNIPLAIAVHGALDPAFLAEILATIARRHESLRTTFAEGPVQVIAPPESAAIDLPSIDLTALPALERPAVARRLAAAEAERRFDLSRGPLVRAALLRLAEQEHVLLLNLHHIIADGWSMGVMVEEIAALYRHASDRSNLPELPIQYADFAVWQRHWLGETELAHQMRFWRERLETAPLSLALPADRPRPAAQSFRGAAIPFVLAPDLAAGLLALGQRCGATPFMTLLAGFSTLLLRLTGQDDLVVGTPIANRNLLETEKLIGFFVNSLPLRLDLAGDPTLAALIAGVRETSLAAYAHQDLPFERLVEELRPERHLAQNPLFQVMFAFQNAPLVPLAEMDLPGIMLEPFPFAVPTTKLDLQLDLTEAETADGKVLLGELRYATDLFDAVTMERLIGHLRTLLAAGVADPELRLADLPLLGEGQRHQIAVEWNADAASRAGASFLTLFADQVARAPEATAVVCDGNA